MSEWLSLSKHVCVYMNMSWRISIHKFRLQTSQAHAPGLSAQARTIQASVASVIVAGRVDSQSADPHKPQQHSHSVMHQGHESPYVVRSS